MVTGIWTRQWHGHATYEHNLCTSIHMRILLFTQNLVEVRGMCIRHTWDWEQDKLTYNALLVLYTYCTNCMPQVEHIRWDQLFHRAILCLAFVVWRDWWSWLDPIIIAFNCEPVLISGSNGKLTWLVTTSPSDITASLPPYGRVLSMRVTAQQLDFRGVTITLEQWARENRVVPRSVPKVILTRFALLALQCVLGVSFVTLLCSVLTYTLASQDPDVPLTPKDHL